MTLCNLSYTEKARLSTIPSAKAFLSLMEQKKTNLCLSADVSNAQALLQLADQLGPEICLLKTHIDIIDDFTPDLTRQLRRLADKHHFFIFEDRKFADIGNTVKQQYQGGIYRIVDWADFINAHVLPGPGIIEGLAAVGKAKHRALILLAEMSSKGNLMDEDYQEKTRQLASQFPDFVMGFVTQHAFKDNAPWIHFTPGVQLTAGQDDLGQQYRTPEEAIINQGTDVIIVGRGIIRAKAPIDEAKRYRQAGWDAYQKRLD